MKPTVKFELTQRQTELLGEFFGENEKDTGMILGQFFEAVDGPGFVVVGFLQNEKAAHLQRMMGIKEGKKSPQIEHEVYTEME